MTWQLIKRDPAWRALPYVTGAAFLCALWMGRPLWALFFGLAASVSIGPVVQLHKRVTMFEAALPIDGRQILRARLTALLLYLWLPLLLLGAGLIFHRLPTAALMAARLAAIGSLGSFTIVAFQTYRLPRFSLHPGLLILAILFVFLSILGATVTPLSFLWLATGVLTLATAVVFARAWPRAPLAFQCAAANPAPPARLTPGFTLSGIWLPAVRALFPWQGAMFLSFAAFSALVGNPMLPLFYLPGYCFAASAGLRWLFTLPVSRRKLLLMLGVPFFGLYALSSVLSATAGFNARRHPILTSTSARDRGVTGAYRIRSSEPVPTITAPWGETYQPPSDRVFLLSSHYDPWLWGENNSKQFRDWQFQRATRAIYGQAVPLARSKDLEHLQLLLERPRMQLISLACLAVVALSLTAGGMLPLWSRLHRIPTGIRNWVSAGLCVAIVVPLGAASFLLPGDGMPVLLDVATVRLDPLLPQNPWAVAVIVVACLAPLCVLIDREFMELELDTRTRKTKGQMLFSRQQDS